jgi:hypothetical protein
MKVSTIWPSYHPERAVRGALVRASGILAAVRLIDLNKFRPTLPPTEPFFFSMTPSRILKLILASENYTEQTGNLKYDPFFDKVNVNRSRAACEAFPGDRQLLKEM